MNIVRKLEDIHQSLILPVEQVEVTEFLTNTENAQRINNLVEDVHEALMDYQVCMLSCSLPTVSDLCTRPHYNKTSTARVFSTLLASPSHLL